MNKKKTAIIGTGIAGMSAAYILHPERDITVFEQDDRIGGHTNTVFVQEGDRQIPIDTGFIVCNNVNYPYLMDLFIDIDAPVTNTSMSFSAQIRQDKIEYCGSSLSLLFAQRKNLFSPRYIRFLYHLNRFNKTSVEVMHDPALQKLNIREYLSLRKYPPEVLEWYILPMSSALWSTEPDTTVLFPAKTLVQFFNNHGFLGLNTQFQWLTVEGGSEVYKQLLIASFKDRIQTGNKIRTVRRTSAGVELCSANGEMYVFDEVVIAAHADQALAMLQEPTTEEKELLSPFAYAKNIATLHTDERLMPALKKTWSSWNYTIDKQNGDYNAYCTYWMNSLQPLNTHTMYFVTINGAEHIATDKIIRQIAYTHPIFTVVTMRAQKALPQLNNSGKIFFAGSYFGYGFHEDACKSGMEAAQALLRNASVS
ncbi:MAG: FAD-dependent oxidoreductase [Chitinophagales bacterium]